ncbi:Sulfotransferase domain [Popillia japonica]|uniref:Sulfotransferase domain n=1 Tax=Popillia japonica TaxID=7064 RepID=A0AAW1K090_POPJA
MPPALCTRNSIDINTLVVSLLELSNFTLATGGQPVRSVVITTWRSGSTFLGDVLNAVPGNFYHYEPLLNFGIVQIRGPPLAQLAINNLKNLLKCNYYDMQNYLSYGKTHIYLFTHNLRLWSECEQYPQFCWNATFLSEFCKLYPFQSMKVVRLRLNLAEELLKDESLNVKVLLLIRDPRGTLQSRKHREWCPGLPDCDQPDLLCTDMVSDYSAAADLQQKYSNRFRAIRYEDLSLNPYKHVRELFDFFGLNFHQNVINFLDSHTKANSGGVSSTFRDSKNAPFHWRNDLNFSEVQYNLQGFEERTVPLA